MHTLSDNCKEFLLDVSKQIDNELSTLYHALEDDQSISLPQWRVYEKIIDHISYLVRTQQEEFY
jgi:hypothetical protein